MKIAALLIIEEACNGGEDFLKAPAPNLEGG
jgi:hypothetical protein